MSLLRSGLRRAAALAWRQGDGPAMEGMLGEVTGAGVPRIREVLAALAQAMNPTDEVVELSVKDPVLTDALRCLMAHRWLAPTVHKQDKQGNMVRSFYTQPHEGGQHLSLCSSFAIFERLQRECALKGTILASEPRTFCQVVTVDLPVMSVEAFRRHGFPEHHAIRTLSLDPLPLVVSAGGAQPVDSVVRLSEMAFPLLRSFCECWALAGAALRVQATVEEQGLDAVGEPEWAGVLCRGQTLVAITMGQSVFTSEAGLLLFCYPGDAGKVLAYHQRQKTPGLAVGQVSPIGPQQLLDLMQWQAERGGSTQVVTVVLEQAEGPRCHGLAVTPELFRSGGVRTALEHSA